MTDNIVLKRKLFFTKQENKFSFNAYKESCEASFIFCFRDSSSIGLFSSILDG